MLASLGCTWPEKSLPHFSRLFGPLVFLPRVDYKNSMPARVTLAESERASERRQEFVPVRGEGIIRRNDFPRESPFAEKFCSPRRRPREENNNRGQGMKRRGKSHAIRDLPLFLRLFYGVIKRVVEGCQIKSRETSRHCSTYPKGKQVLL